MMLERLAFQWTVDEVFDFWQVEEGDLHLAVLALLVLEDALQLMYVAIIDDGTITITELDVFLGVVLR